MNMSIDECTNQIIKYLKKKQIDQIVSFRDLYVYVVSPKGFIFKNGVIGSPIEHYSVNKTTGEVKEFELLSDDELALAYRKEAKIIKKYR